MLKNGLPYIQPGLRLNQEEFKALWKQAQPEAKDTLAFMWAIGEVALPLGAMEVVTASPSFYISRYCVRAMDQIANHHRKYYTNPHFKTELPTSPSYGEKEITTVHNSIAKSREEHEDAMRTYEKEDLILFKEARRFQQWLKKYHADSFPLEFFDISLQNFATRAIKDYEHTVAKRNCLLHTNDIILLLPSLNPCHWRIDP